MRPVPMVTRLLVRLTATVTLSFLGALACSSDCGDAGCVSAVFMDGSIDTTSQQLVVTACFNQRCASGELDLGVARCARLALSSDSRICAAEAAPGRLAMTLEVHSIGGEVPFNNGDVVTLEVADKSTSAVVADVERAVTYEAVYPNGPDCDDQPCQAANVQF
jgi:hypothetical protein